MPVFNAMIRFRWRAFAHYLLALPAAVFLPSARSPAQTLDYRSQDQAPASWGQFAKLVKYRFETWGAADEPVANRFRAYVVDHAGKDGGPPETLVVKAWLNPDGTVERVSFPSLPDAKADDDLHAIL